MTVKTVEAEASFKNEEELDILYSVDVKSTKEKRKIKEIILKENPEMLLSDYTGAEENRVRCNLLFFTEHPSVWHTVLSSNMTCCRRGGISKGRQLTLEGENDFKIIVNLYHNGTVMVQGPESSLEEFQRNFKNLKMEVQKIKKDPEVKNITADETCTTADNNTDQRSYSAPTYRDISTPTSPKIKILRDNLSELEQDYCLFKEETSNSLHQLQSLINHPNTQHMKQLHNTVRQLEEDNEEMRQELRRVRQELVTREQHYIIIERQTDEMRRQLNTLIQHNKHNTSSTENTAQHQPEVNTLSQSISTAEETQRLQDIVPSTQSTSTERNSTNTTQHGQNIGTQRKSISSTTITQTINSQDNRRKKSSVRQSNPLTTTSPNSTNREERRKENIVILCDSNGHHLHQRRLFPGRNVKKFWCPTSQSALNLLREDVLGAPTHIILHTGTNDLTGRRTDVTKALSDVLRTACRIYPSAKVIFSTLLPRRDIPQNIIYQINGELARVCAQLKNVSIANHQRISHDHLYDHIHIHRDGMRLFAQTLKEATLRSPHTTHRVHEERVRQTVSYTTADNRDLHQIKHMLKLICDNFLH